jgi:FKBP-type peptidyl-prolyl cis-trans isomerase FkpA
MRFLFLIVPAFLVAQAPPPPKPAAAKPKPAAAAKPAAPKPPARPAAASIALTTDEEKSIYALGLSMYKSLGQFDLSPHELEIVKRALADAAAHKPAVDLNEWGPKIGPLARERSARVAEQQKAASKVYLEKAVAEPGAVRTESGLIYRELTPGSGDSPKATDTVKVNYRGTLVDGTEFDSSYRRNEPAQFALNGVIRCWTEGVQKMKPGGKAKLVCPAELAYGEQGRPSIPGGATLIFEIELLEISAAAK